MTEVVEVAGEVAAREDETARHRTLRVEREAMRVQLEQSARAAKKIKFWATLAFLVAGAGFATAMFLFGTFAKGTTVDNHETRIGIVETKQAVQGKTQELQGKTLDDIHVDFKWLVRQGVRSARAVGATVEPLPEHEKGQP